MFVYLFDNNFCLVLLCGLFSFLTSFVSFALFSAFRDSIIVMSKTSQLKTCNTSIKNDIIQECRTYLRWVNVKLNQNNVKPISNLQTDLCDGMVLVELFEICSGRKIGDKFTKVNTKLRQHHIDRIALVLNCMRNENIELIHGGIGEYDDVAAAAAASFICQMQALKFTFCFFNSQFYVFMYSCMITDVCHVIGLDPDKIISGDIEIILTVLWSLIWHYSIAATIFESHQISNSIDAYESKKYRLNCCFTYCLCVSLFYSNKIRLFIFKDFYNGFK